MVAAPSYSLRSESRGYNLRSKAVSTPSIQNPPTNTSRCVGKRRVSKSSPSNKKRKAAKPKEDMEDIRFRKSPEVEKTAYEFATAAISYLHEQGDNYELVKPGLYSGGVISGGTLFHHNFKAKWADDPSEPVETFFSQVFVPSYPSSEGLTVECCVSLGESDSLPVKRDNHGCLFCSNSVHHLRGGCKGINIGWPSWSDDKVEDCYYELVKLRLALSVRNPRTKTFRCVGKQHVGKSSASKKKRTTVKSKEDMEDISFRKFPVVEEAARKYATAATSYLREKGCNYELVKPGLYSGAVISGGTLFHHNFKAKWADDPSAPVETFFSQVFVPRYPSSKGLTVECCVSLGESDSLPVKRDNRGCLFCHDCVYHPIGGCKGIKIGWRSLSKMEKYDKVEEQLSEESEE